MLHCVEVSWILFRSKIFESFQFENILIVIKGNITIMSGVFRFLPSQQIFRSAERSLKAGTEERKHKTMLHSLSVNMPLLFAFTSIITTVSYIKINNKAKKLESTSARDNRNNCCSKHYLVDHWCLIKL